MNDNRDLEALIRFLDYLRDKGLMKSATAQTRKNTVNKILTVLPKEELIDVTILDVTDVMQRFHNLEGQNYTPGSIGAYKSRLKATLEDFRSYLENPLGFRPAVKSRASRSKPSTSTPSEKPKSMPGGRTSDQIQPPTLSPTTREVQPSSSNIIPIPLRSDLVVRIHGIPFDMTTSEAKKLSAVIQALAVIE